MKAMLIVDIPDDYDEYGSGDWYVVGDDLRIVYEEDGALMHYKFIDDDMAQLKPMPKKLDAVEIAMQLGRYLGRYKVSDELAYQVKGYNRCIEGILGEVE